MDDLAGFTTDLPADFDANGAAAHDAAVRRDLELLGLPARNWPASVVGPDGAPMADVLVIGAGMCGIAAAAALSFKGVRNLRVLDRAPAGIEGPWVTTARMRTLRSPKTLPGIALGLPSLSFRAWFEARHGAAGWEALYKVSNADWQSYLTWVRTVLGLPVRNGVGVTRITPAAGAVAVSLRDGATLHARRVVVATGRGGLGGFAIPSWVDRALWPDRAAHTGEAIDFAALAGRRVAVVGAGPSAWDNAATALEAGAARVDMFVRRAQLPQVNKGRGSANPGFFEGWAALSMAERWSLLVWLHDLQAPPPHESVHRALAHPGFALHLASPVMAATRDAAGVALTIGAAARRVTADFVILGTGFAVDLARQPELADLAPDLATWADRYQPPSDLVRPELGRFPFLGPAFELQERAPGAHPGLDRVHLFNHAAYASLGPIASDIPGVSTGAERLASRIAQAFFREDFAHMRATLAAFDEPELEGTPFFVPR
jgi:cation diffusion facilitator CzcD-associated flavoprotein CzcO